MNFRAVGKAAFPLAMVGLLTLGLLVILGDGRTRAAPADIITFQGRVIEGPTGTEPGVDPDAHYIQGAGVSLWCGGGPYPNQGTFVISATTDVNGYFGLTLDTEVVGCEYFHVIETDPEGRSSNGAATVDGEVKTANWIQFDVIEAPITEQDLTGNKFWDAPLPAEATCTSCTDCSSKLDGRYTKVRLVQDISISINGPCVRVGASNVTFDGGGYIIENTATGVEFDIGVDVVGRTQVTLTNIILDDWATGIRLINANGNSILTNTITMAGTGIHMDSADTNILAGNVISKSVTAVRLAGADTNTFAHNTFCRQSKRDIEASGTTSGNVQSANTCDIVYNWNGDQALSECDSVCAPLYPATTCGSAAACSAALDGTYGIVTLGGNVVAAGGISIGGNHVTLDCSGHDIIGTGSGAGVSFTDRVGVTVEGCTIRNFNTGIEVRSSASSHLESNTLYSNTVGIALVKTDAVIQPQDNMVGPTNYVHDNTLYGIRLSNAHNNSVLSNYVSDSGFYDLWVEGDCRNSISESGVAYYHDQSGGTVTPANQPKLLLLCNVDGALVTGVAINNSTTWPFNNGLVVIDSSGTEVRGADLSYTRGINVVDSDHITVTNSSVISSTGDGITFEGSSYGAVISNSVTLSGGYGIALLSGSGSTKVIGNTLGASRTTTTGANAGGILVRDSGGVTLQENWVRRNSGNGVSLEGASQVAITKNTVRGNQYGLYIDNHTSQTTVNQNEVCYSTGQDIYNNAGTGATGDNNTCYDRYNWTDTGETSDCTNRCVGWYNRDWGFSFVNPVVDNLSYTRYTDTFGKDETWKSVDLCVGVPICFLWKCWCVGKNIEIPTGLWDEWAAIYYYAAYQNLGEPGTCFGVAAQSLAFFYGDDDPANYDPTADEVKDLSANSTNGSYDLRADREIHHGSQLSSEAMGYYLSALASGQADAGAVTTAAVAGLENEQMNFVLIKDGVLSGHAMNYDSVVAESATVARIYVYDNNKTTPVTSFVDTPTGYPHIDIGLAANNWSYQMGSETWGSDMIFDMPYSIVNRSDWTLPLSLDGIANAIFGSSAQAGIADMEGHWLGYDAAGVAHEDIPGGMGLPVWGATTAENGHRLLVQPGDYDIHIFGGDGPYTDTIMGLSGGYMLEGIPATTATDDLFRFRIVDGNPLHTTLGLATLDAPKPVNLSLVKGWGLGGDNRTFRIFQAVLGPDTMLWTKVLPDLSGVVLANRGAAPFPFALEISNTMVREGAAYPPEGPVAFIEGFVVQPGHTLVVSPEDWGDLTHSEIAVTESTCGNGAADLGEDTVNCPADVAAAPSCVTPHDDLVITGDMLLCPGTYNIGDAGASGVLQITGSNLTLDCNGATIRGTGAGIGIFVDDTSAITVTHCQVEGYDVGLSLSEVSGANVTESILKMNELEGLHVSEVLSLYVRELYVAANGRGITLYNVGGAEIVRTAICPNVGTDIEVQGSSGLTGNDNACDEAINWHDGGVEQCTYSCIGGDEPGGSAIFLPLVLRH